ITVNKNMVPFDTQSPFITSGIRIGTPAVTTRGLKEKDMEKIVDWIDTLLMNKEDEAKIGDIRNQVNAFMKGFPLYA
ncbi:MAG: serine hydroxymethyltransferase, partial [Chitinophagales bacterium]